MAGLNDDVDEGLEDLEEDFKPEEINLDPITPNINSNQPEPDPVILVTQNYSNKEGENKEPSIQDLFGDAVIPGEIPNLNAEFVIIQQRSDSLDDFKTTSFAIGDRKSICQEDAKLLDALAPGFLNDETKPIGYFTKDNTKTFFDETVKDMNSYVYNENKEIDELLKNHLTKLDKQYNDFINIYVSKYKTLLLEQNINIKKLFFDIVLNHKNDISCLLKDNHVLNYLLSISISTIDTDEIISNKDLLNHVKSLKDCLKNTNLRSYLLSFAYTSTGSLVYANTPLDNDDNIFSINSAIKLHMNGSQTILPFDILLKLTNNQTKVNELKIKCVTYTRRATDTENLLEANKNDILKLAEDYKHLTNLLIGITNFNDLVIKIIKMFA